MEKFELQKLRDLPIEGVAERLGLRVERHKSLCPFHDDSHPSLSFSVRRNTYRCFVCGASGGTIDLVMRHLKMDFKAACRWLANEHNVILDEWKPQITQKEPSLLCNFDASRYSHFFEHPWLSAEARKFLFDERKLDPRVVSWCRLTSWRDKQGTPWLQIPYFNREGKLIGVQNRRLKTIAPAPPSLTGGAGGGSAGSVPRFRFPQGSQCGIYNLPVLNLLKPNEPLFITEGCSDCWAMLSAGHKAIAIPSATLLTQKDVDILSTLNSPLGPQGRLPEQELSTEFHMWPDNDEPGERLFLQLKQVLPSLVHHQLPLGCKDYSELYLKTHPQSPPIRRGEGCAKNEPTCPLELARLTLQELVNSFTCQLQNHEIDV